MSEIVVKVVVNPPEEKIIRVTINKADNDALINDLKEELGDTDVDLALIYNISKL